MLQGTRLRRSTREELNIDVCLAKKKIARDLFKILLKKILFQNKR